jgi:V/A-type H+-transporting ATPase subunit K
VGGQIEDHAEENGMLSARLKLLVFASLLFTLLGSAAWLTLTLFPATAAAAEAGAPAVDAGVLRWGYMAAALATGLSALAAGIAVAGVGAAAVGAVAEKPEMFGRTLVFVGLAEGIAIYGLIISIMILNRLV